MTPALCREARERLGWTAERLGLRSGLAGTTVRRFEAGNTPRPYQRTVPALRRIFEAEGIEFTPLGVVLRKEA